MMQFREGTLRCECAAEGITCVCEERLKAEREAANGAGEETTEWTESETETGTRREKMTWIEEWGHV